MIELKVNGTTYSLDVDPETPLLWVIRDNLNLTGTKFGCGIAQCGACTVHVNGYAQRSCQTKLREVGGKEITTIEGLSKGNELHPLQQTFLEGTGMQCGFCTPGFLIAASALLDENPEPTEEEIRHWLVGNLCRCTGYDKIVKAVQDAALILRERTL